MRATHAMMAMLVGSSLGLVACSDDSGGDGDDNQSRSFADGGTYTTPIGSDPGNLHPLKAVRVVTNSVVAFAYDSLIGVSEDGKVVPQLAESWEATPKSVTYTLRDDVTCEDGTKLTASHVAANFEWHKVTKNASASIGSGLPDTNYTVESNDSARTVTITFAEPFGFGLQGAGTVLIVCPAGLADPKLLETETDGTGPFVLTENVADDHLNFEVREDYRWGPDGASTDEPGFPDDLVFRIVQDESTAVNLFLSGELNEAGASGPDRARLEGQDFLTLESLAGPAEFWFNQRPDFVTADLAIREALVTAMDLDETTEVYTSGTGERATSLTVYPPNPCPDPTVEGNLPEYDPEAAAAVLDEAGWVEGEDGVRVKDGEELALTLIFPAGDDALDAAMERVIQRWEELGVAVESKPQPETAFVQTLFAGNDWDVAWLGVNINYPYIFRPFATGPPSPEGQNFAAVDNDDYTELSAEAVETPGEASCDLWEDAEKALFRNLDVVPVANTSSVTYVRDAEISLEFTPTSIRLLAE